MGKIKSDKTVPAFLEDLALRGQYYFTMKEIMEGLSIKEASLSVSLSRLSSKGKVKLIRNGFGIITGFTRGVLHPSYFLDAMMKHLNSKYYVGLLSAASHWGASHQAAMIYYVVADKVIKPISLGRIKIVFLTKNNFEEIEETQKVQGPGGYYLVSTPELTAIDLIRFPKKSGHLNNVATVLEDLLEKVDLKKMQTLCSKISTPTVTLQRLGYILEKVLHKENEAQCIETILLKRKVSRSLLSVSKKQDNKMNFSKFPFDAKWKIYQNTVVEPD